MALWREMKNLFSHAPITTSIHLKLWVDRAPLQIWNSVYEPVNISCHAKVSNLSHSVRPRAGKEAISGSDVSEKHKILYMIYLCDDMKQRSLLLLCQICCCRKCSELRFAMKKRRPLKNLQMHDYSCLQMIVHIFQIKRQTQTAVKMK